MAGELIATRKARITASACHSTDAALVSNEAATRYLISAKEPQPCALRVSKPYKGRIYKGKLAGDYFPPSFHSLDQTTQFFPHRTVPFC